MPSKYKSYVDAPENFSSKASPTHKSVVVVLSFTLGKLLMPVLITFEIAVQPLSDLNVIS